MSVTEARRWPLGPLTGWTERAWWAAAFSLIVLVLSVVPALAAHARLNYDSGLYLSTPTLESGRLPLVPVVFLVLGHNLQAITVFQALAGGACWSALLWEAAHVRRRGLRLFVMSGLTAVACSTYVVQWYAAVLSESLSISLLVLVIALLARWERTGASLWGVVVATGLWALTRSTNAYIVVFAGLLLLSYSALKRRRQVIKALVVTAVALLGTWMSAQGQLWQQPFLHSMSERILPDPTFTAWFEAHGMPVTDRLRQLAGPDTVATDAAFHHSPALASFRRWMDDSGKRTYVEFLATHPGWVLDGTFGHHEELAPATISYYGGGVDRPWVPAAIRDVLLRGRQDTLLALCALDGVAIVASLARREWSRAYGAWMGVIFLGFATLAVDWAGDSWEVGRHSVEGTLAVAIAALVLIGCHPSGSRRGTARRGWPNGPRRSGGPPLTPSTGG